MLCDLKLRLYLSAVAGLKIGFYELFEEKLKMVALIDLLPLLLKAFADL